MDTTQQKQTRTPSYYVAGPAAPSPCCGKALSPLNGGSVYVCAQCHRVCESED